MIAQPIDQNSELEELEGLGIIDEKFSKTAAHLKAPELLSVSEWADAYRILPTTASEPGRWKTSRTPYLKDIMDALSPQNPLQRITVMKSAQVGMSEAANNWLGHMIHLNPMPTMVVYPKEEVLKRWVKTKFYPMIEASKELSSRIAPPQKKRQGNTLGFHAFAGGYLCCASACSPKELRSVNVGYIVMDEIDGFDASNLEGDPLSLAEARTITYPKRKKILLISTPLVKGTSNIEKHYLASDRRKYFVPCPGCDHEQALRFSQVKWQETPGKQTISESIHYACEACGYPISENERQQIIHRGRWQPTAISENPQHAGFHISALYSPWVSLETLVEQYRKSKHIPLEHRTFYNLWLGEPWEERIADSLDPCALYAAREDFKDRVPEGAYVLTAGVDVAIDRLIVQVIAWGDKENEAWVLDYHVITGNPSEGETWSQLDAYLQKPWHFADGQPLTVATTFIDSGFLTSTVYAFCQDKSHRQVFPSKGIPAFGAPLATRPKKQKTRMKALLQIVGASTGKAQLFAKLKITEPGPGFIHFSKKLDQAYFEELSAEHLVERKGKFIWEKATQRAQNEALDTFILAMAALEYLRVDWEALRRLKNPEKMKAAPYQEREMIRPRHTTQTDYINQWRRDV